MVRYCGVAECNNNDHTVNRVFYSFPGIRKSHYEITCSRHSKWLAALKIDVLPESKRRNFWICEDHFISGLF